MACQGVPTCPKSQFCPGIGRRQFGSSEVTQYNQSCTSSKADIILLHLPNLAKKREEKGEGGKRKEKKEGKERERKEKRERRREGERRRREGKKKNERKKERKERK